MLSSRMKVAYLDSRYGIGRIDLCELLRSKTWVQTTEMHWNELQCFYCNLRFNNNRNRFKIIKNINEFIIDNVFEVYSKISKNEIMIFQRETSRTFKNSQVMI